MSPLEAPTAKDQITATIMVVEDDPLQRNLMKTALQMAGHRVVEAKDGVEALQFLDESAPDLIIADINMPNIDGLDLLKALRANPETANIPFLLATANSAPDDIHKGFQLGADDYLTKPVSLLELQARVAAKISRPSVPFDQLPYDRRTGLLNESAFLDEVWREVLRAGNAGEKGWLAYIGVKEHASLKARFADRHDTPIVKQMMTLIEQDQLPLETQSANDDEDLLILIADASGVTVKERLARFVQRMTEYNFVVGEERVQVTPLIGLVSIVGDTPAERLLEQGRAAARYAVRYPQMPVVEYEPAHDQPTLDNEAGSQTAETAAQPVFPAVDELGPLPLAAVLGATILLTLLFVAAVRLLQLSRQETVYALVVISVLVAVGLIWRRLAVYRQKRAARSSVTARKMVSVPPYQKAGKLPPSPSGRIAATVMVVEDDPLQLKVISMALKLAGYEVVEAKDGVEALHLLDKAAPDLIITDINMPTINGLELLKALRANPETEAIPFILATASNTPDDIATGFRLGADDYLSKPISLIELQARVTAKLSRPSVPAEQLKRDRQTGLLTISAFVDEVKREALRAKDAADKSCVVCVSLSERDALIEHFGGRIYAPIIKQMITIAEYDRLPLEIMGMTGDHDLLFLIPGAAVSAVKERLHRFSRRMVRHTFVFGEESVRLTPIVGYVLIHEQAAAEHLIESAQAASLFAGLHLDLQAVEYQPSMAALAHEIKKKTQTVRQIRPWKLPNINWRTAFQVTLTLVLGLLVPFFMYALLDRLGFDITQEVYIVVVVGLFLTASLIWLEGMRALRRVDPPEVPNKHYPPASAIIAAYLPNEAATVEATIEAFLRLDYPAPIQVILAYNSPRDMPIERVFAEIAARDSRFIPFRVKNSTSKAQNVNAALTLVKGKFVGVFDADHHPDPDSFRRAWRWLANGYDIVQGHCLVRNGDASWVARTVAVEFEAIYAVSHPGRARLHNFGIFGGSNGYWKTELLRETRMHGFMLTEDIDSSFRVISSGYKIASDPYLISRELATTTVKALWNQRMRWAQGWYQVTLVQTPRLLRSKRLTFRQKLGVFHLLVWREIYPWLSWQMLPIIAYWSWKFGGLDKLDWFVPIFILTSIFTMTTGPLQLLFIRRLAEDSIRKRRRWMWWYLLMTSFAYVEYKNLIARVAQIKEIMGERVWKVTARG